MRVPAELLVHSGLKSRGGITSQGFHEMVFEEYLRSIKRAIEGKSDPFSSSQVTIPGWERGGEGDSENSALNEKGSEIFMASQ